MQFAFARMSTSDVFAALRRLMANVSLKRFLRCRVDLVFGAIEIRLRHPTID